MRILISADPMLPVPPERYGGIERIIAVLIDYLRNAGHQVALLAKNGSNQECDELFIWPQSSQNGLIATFLHQQVMSKAIHQFQPEIVHSFSRLAYLAPQFLSARPMIMSFQRQPSTHTVKWSARLAGKQLRFTGCSEYIAQAGRLCGGHWEAIPNFIAHDAYTFRESVKPDAPLVFLSRLDAVKGVDLAIDIAIAAGRKIIVAGNIAPHGPDRDYYETQVQPRLKLPGVEYIGAVNDEEKNLLLGSAAALIVPIQWDEPFGIVFIEALACGTPIITCRRGALPEIVAPDQHGYFISTLEQGVQAVHGLANLSRRACREQFEAKFTDLVVGQQYENLYQRMTKSVRNYNA